MIAALFDEKRRISRKHQKHRQHNWSLLKIPSNPKLGGNNVAMDWGDLNPAQSGDITRNSLFFSPF